MSLRQKMTLKWNYRDGCFLWHILRLVNSSFRDINLPNIGFGNVNYGKIQLRQDTKKKKKKRKKKFVFLSCLFLYPVDFWFKNLIHIRRKKFQQR